MPPIRVACFIDGFNLYHAIHDLRRSELKWVDLRKLMGCFLDPNVHTLGSVYYFSAYATWLPGPHARHLQYVAALQATGTTPLMGHFKDKDRRCPRCGHVHNGHEEKESDVHLATRLIAGAFDNEFDQAFVVSRDSDLAPPLHFIRSRFPKKKLKVIAPPARRHSKELWAIATHRAAVDVSHLERCLFPREVSDVTGAVVAKRPAPYDPPI